MMVAVATIFSSASRFHRTKACGLIWREDRTMCRPGEALGVNLSRWGVNSTGLLYR
jgi:hypothetical protein